jgi:hypothetical protein
LFPAGAAATPRVLTISGTAAPPHVSGTPPPPFSTWSRMWPQKKSRSRLPSKRCRMRCQKKIPNIYFQMVQDVPSKENPKEVPSKGARCVLKRNTETGSTRNGVGCALKRRPEICPLPNVARFALTRKLEVGSFATWACGRKILCQWTRYGPGQLTFLPPAARQKIVRGVGFEAPKLSPFLCRFLFFLQTEMVWQWSRFLFKRAA